MPSLFAVNHQIALRQRTIEMFGLPGDRCADPACRRQGRCRSRALQDPDCLQQLAPVERTFYARLLKSCHWADDNHIHFLGDYIDCVDDPYVMLVGEIVRRAQPRGHWMHAALPRWYKMTTRKPGRAHISLAAAAQAPARYY